LIEVDKIQSIDWLFARDAKFPLWVIFARFRPALSMSGAKGLARFSVTVRFAS
jgi:hypothetical protein